MTNYQFNEERTKNTAFETKIQISGGLVKIQRYSKEYLNYKNKTSLEERLSELDLVEEVDDDHEEEVDRKVLCDVECNQELEKELVPQKRGDNMTRTRNLLLGLALSNEEHWKSFITLTFAENVKDVATANTYFNKWRTQFARGCKKEGFSLKYLCVPEFQKRGAVHYHILTNVPLGSELLPKQKYKQKMYDVKYWPHGFCSGFDVKNKVDANFNIGLYMIKYMLKDLDKRLFQKKKVLSSRNLEKPIDLIANISEDKVVQVLMYLVENGYELFDSSEITSSDNFKRDYLSYQYMAPKNGKEFLPNILEIIEGEGDSEIKEELNRTARMRVWIKLLKLKCPNPYDEGELRDIGVYCDKCTACVLHSTFTEEIKKRKIA